MSFAADMSGFRMKFMTRTQRVVYEVGQEAFRSIVDGSSLTGAPGQPVDEGELKGSWRLEFPSPNEAKVTTRLGPKAWAIENGVRRVGGTRRKGGRKIRLTIRSQVGGSHSVKLTRAGIQRIIDAVVRRVGTK